VAAIMAAISGTMLAWWNLGLPRLVFLPELAPIHARIEALEQFNRDTRSRRSTKPWWSANPVRRQWRGGNNRYCHRAGRGR
jgi:hypothetical protein